MASENVNQIYMSNPATTLQSTDLFYLGRFPYNTSDDFACSLTTLQQYSVLQWTTVSTATQTMNANNGYITLNPAALVVYTLPSTSAVGSMIRVAGISADGWAINQNAGQQIIFGNTATTVGTGGSISSVNRYDCIELLCVVANTTFLSLSEIGSISYV